VELEKKRYRKNSFFKKESSIFKLEEMRGWTKTDNGEQS